MSLIGGRTPRSTRTSQDVPWWIPAQHPEWRPVLQFPHAQLLPSLRPEQGSSWTFLPRSLAEEQPGISGCLPLLGGRGLGEPPRGLLHHHDPSHPVDPEPCVRRLRQELRSLAGEVLPWSETELPGAKQLQAFQRQGAAWRVSEDVHLRSLSEPVPMAQ